MSEANERPLLLLVDDDPAITDTLAWALEADFEICVAANRPQAMALLRGVTRPLDLALIDLGLPPFPHRPDEGLALVSDLLAAQPRLKIVVLSGQDAESSARHARALGAHDFVAKPATPATLRASLQAAAQLSRAESRDHADIAPRLLGESAPMRALRERIQAFCDTPFPVLISGESGTGKELAAQALHEAGKRRERPFVALNCAAIAPGLIEAALFGHGRGAFTGSSGSRHGFFEEAANGTLFLDEIGELPLELQPKLLRVLENGEFRRVGETQIRHASARVLAATNRTLRDEVRGGRFRSDLYHRLSVLDLTLPPLRQLGEDRFRLLDHFRSELSQRIGMAPFRLSPEAATRWASYAFPGNVRELRNIVMRLLARFGGQEVGLSALEAELDPAAGDADLGPQDSEVPGGIETELASSGFSLVSTLERSERSYISAALRLSQGSVSGAARLLGISRTTLYGRLSALGMRSAEEGPAP